MTKKDKNPNSILVLATLGVYFGLILAGAVPQVLGQAAMARQFDIKDEIEQKDDLDKKPDGDKALEQFAAALEDLYRITSEISADAKRGNNGKFGIEYFVTIKPNGVSMQYSPTGEGSWSGKFREPLRNLYDAFLPRSDDWNENFLVEFNVSKDQVTLKTTIITDPGSTAQALSGFEQALLRRRSNEMNFVRSQIYDASKITVEKNKIIVVANLPRAGLESLLTKNG
ncbi:hypothetical protein BH20ACI2_BH20ACI2_18070 [soil metagenome]